MVHLMLVTMVKAGVNKAWCYLNKTYKICVLRLATDVWELTALRYLV